MEGIPGDRIRVFVLAFAPEAYLLEVDGGGSIDIIYNSDEDEDEDEDQNSTRPVRCTPWSEVLHLPGRPLLVGDDEFDDRSYVAP